VNIDLIKQRLSLYQANTLQEKEQALKEITQEIILMSLSRQQFFSNAEFHGGTALRILYDLQRFSEDLDFALLKPNKSFALTPFLRGIAEELKAFGYDFEIKDRSDVSKTIKKAFLKDSSIGKLFILNRTGHTKKLSIKLEVDSNPPAGADTELKYLNFPMPFGIQCKDLPSSFSGKIHALLCRKYIKGRDWYDFIWYITQKTNVNYVLLANALEQQGPWKNTNTYVNKEWLINALQIKVKSINWTEARQDISPFIKAQEQSALAPWSQDFFLAEIDLLNRNIS
jgi:predicted nucleotidyltransferase component of viral defense system